MINLPSESSVPARRSYGPFVRVVEPDRHIYRSVIDYRRWILGLFSVFGVGFFSWVAQWTYRSATSLAIFSALLAIPLIWISYAMFAIKTRVEITPRDVILTKKGLWGRPLTRRWSIFDIETVGVEGNPTFHIGGATDTYAVSLRFSDGKSESLFITFDDLGPAERLSIDIAESVKAMAERQLRTAPELF